MELTSSSSVATPVRSQAFPKRRWGQPERPAKSGSEDWLSLTGDDAMTSQALRVARAEWHQALQELQAAQPQNSLPAAVALPAATQVSSPATTRRAMKWSRSRATPVLLTVLLLWQVWSPSASLEEGFACVGEKREGCVDSPLDDATSSRSSRAASGRRAAMLAGAAAAGAAPAVAEEPKTQWKRLRQIQYIAALGDPNANSGKGAEDWGLWRKDPGPRGVRLYNYDKLKQRGGLAPAQWQFDDKDWWLEEHGLIMEKPEFPMPPGKYLVTGDREVTTTLTVSEKDANGVQTWSLGDNAKLYDVTHLPCRSARYTPQGNGGCEPVSYSGEI
eukprot:s756_g14.t1